MITKQKIQLKLKLIHTLHLSGSLKSAMRIAADLLAPASTFLST
jgi:hypothetical protein